MTYVLSMFLATSEDMDSEEGPFSIRPYHSQYKLWSMYLKIGVLHTDHVPIGALVRRLRRIPFTLKDTRRRL